MPVFSLDPTTHTTILTVAVHMFVWHICTHTGNQMTVQRYLSTTDTRAAIRSFVTGSLFGVGINLLLLVVGLALVYRYAGRDAIDELGLDVSKVEQRDLVFPMFAVHAMPPGLGGAVLAALLAAAMSSIDSGINSMATVVSVEIDQRRRECGIHASTGKHVARGRWLTFAFGAFITAAAYALDFLPSGLGIVAAMPRTFNAITGPIGGLFFIGMFLPAVGGRSAVAATLLGLTTSVGIGYSQPLSRLLVEVGLLENPWPVISFTWVMPCALAVTLGSAACLGALFPARRKLDSRLTWRAR
jgi:SSS family solute:Na+ symporter